MPGRGVGGKGSPFTTVRSTPVEPPRGPTCSYWPDRGAVLPGGSFDMMVSFYDVPASTARLQQRHDHHSRLEPQDNP